MMESLNHIRPTRAVIRCKAKMLLLQIAADQAEPPTVLDEELFQDVAATLFQSDYCGDQYRLCRNKRDVDRASEQLAAEIAKTYRQILLQRQASVVQSLNALLE